MNKDIQNKKVEKLYSEIAKVYDTDFSGKANYKALKMLVDIFNKYKITDGIVLDLGCGTGEISHLLKGNFSFKGVDISKPMLEIAKSRGYEVFNGDILNELKKFEDDSVDHVIALSSLYFVENFNEIIEEIERVSKKSYFLTLEQFSDETKGIMKKRGIEIVNHPKEIIKKPTEVIEDTHIWTRPNTSDEIYGDIIFKILN